MSAAVVGVVSDDLSGGLAVGGELSARGLDVRLRTLPCDGPPPSADAVVVDTASRHAATDVAVAANHAAFALLAAAGATVVVAKLDSMLRGRPGQEVAWALRETGEERCLVVPASPRYGRRTVDGRQLLPSGEGIDAVALLRHGADEPVAVLPLDVVDRGPDAIASVLPGLWEQARIVVADAEEQRHIDDAVAAAGRHDVRLFAGTYGLGAAVAGLVGAGPVVTSPTGPDATGPDGATRPVVLVAGSASDVTRDQVRRLAAAGATVIPVDATAALAPGGPSADEVARAQAAVDVALRAGRDAVLQTAATDADVAVVEGRAAHRGVAVADVAARIGALLAAVLDPALHDGVRTVLVTGGETARSLYDAWGAHGAHLGAELFPGSPLAHLQGGRYEGLVLVTKPGAYGDPDALTAAVARLHGGRTHTERTV